MKATVVVACLVGLAITVFRDVIPKPLGELHQERDSQVYTHPPCWPYGCGKRVSGMDKPGAPGESSQLDQRDNKIRTNSPNWPFGGKRESYKGAPDESNELYQRDNKLKVYTHPPNWPYGRKRESYKGSRDESNQSKGPYTLPPMPGAGGGKREFGMDKLGVTPLPVKRQTTYTYKPPPWKESREISNDKPGALDRKNQLDESKRQHTLPPMPGAGGGKRESGMDKLGVTPLPVKKRAH